jgi:hypothetical protein
MALAALAASSHQARIERAIDVLVLDATGAPVRDLIASDFDVKIAGVPTPVLHAAPAPTALAVALIVDSTVSQPLRRLDLHVAVRDGWIEQLQPGDRARFGLIGPTRMLSGWLPESKSTAATLALGLLDRAPAEPSPIWDALVHAIGEIAGAPGPRAILLISDGRANGNVLGLDDVLDRALAAEIAISTVSEAAVGTLPQSGGVLERVRPDDTLRRLADETGGLFRPDGIARRQLRARDDPYQYVQEAAGNPNRPAPLVASIMTSLRQRHRLTVLIPPGGSTGSLSIAVRRPGLTAIARRRLQ